MVGLQERLARLRRLGLRRGAAHLEPKSQRPPATQRALSVEKVVDGRVCSTPVGDCFVAEECWPLSHLHGDLPLSAALRVPSQALTRLADLSPGETFDLRRAVFFDVETSGLSGGTGTYAFQVGVGFFQDDAFCVQQFFMRDLSEEAAHLHAVGELLDRFDAVVSFNGRSFDVPLLNTRFTLARQPRRLLGTPHLDLLLPSRRLWGRRLESCSLASLEQEVLGLRRSEQEVPGWLVPRIYFDYIQTGDAAGLAGVFYHNQIDILSMVTLTARLGLIFNDPQAAAPLEGLDLYSLGRWYERAGMAAESEAAYRAALAESLPADVEEAAWRSLSFLLKGQERFEEAALVWRQVAENGGGRRKYAHVELAKHYEWRSGDLPAAAAVTRQAIDLLKDSASDRQNQETLDELAHRLRRLERKIERQ